jgi:hypothetical protein
MVEPKLQKKIEDLVRTQLGDIADKPGAILYNGWQTLRRGKVYIMGLNPGGAPSEVPQLVIGAVKKHSESDSAYLDEEWGNSHRHYERGKSPHQRRVVELARILGCEIRDTFAANAIFVAGKLPNPTLPEPQVLWDRCWPVHQLFLEIVRPNIILCLGNGAGLSSFALLQRKAEPPVHVQMVAHSYRDGKSFKSNFLLSDGSVLQCTVVGAPHPSWVQPTDRFKRFLASITGS